MISEKSKLTSVAGATAAGTTEVDSSIIDMQGFEGVLFIVSVGTVSDSGVDTLNIQENASDATGGMADVPGAQAVFTDSGAGTSGGLIVVDVYRPQERFLRAQLLRTVANTVVNSIVAIQYNTFKPPAVQDSSVIAITKVAPVS